MVVSHHLKKHQNPRGLWLQRVFLCLTSCHAIPMTVAVAVAVALPRFEANAGGCRRVSPKATSGAKEAVPWPFWRMMLRARGPRTARIKMSGVQQSGARTAVEILNTWWRPDPCTPWHPHPQGPDAGVPGPPRGGQLRCRRRPESPLAFVAAIANDTATFDSLTFRQVQHCPPDGAPATPTETKN